MAIDVERLFAILSNPDFLSMKGLANEVPIFIQTYEPENEDPARKMIKSLAARLKTSGLQLSLIDLFEIVCAHLEEEGRLDKIIEKEPGMGKTKLQSLLCNLTDPPTRFIPRLMRAVGEDNQLTLLYGVGRVFPFLRTHTILEALQPAMVRHPVIMFFPGQYTQGNGLGSQLRLFGKMVDPPMYRPYYRAFNLEQYRI